MAKKGEVEADRDSPLASRQELSYNQDDQSSSSFGSHHHEQGQSADSDESDDSHSSIERLYFSHEHTSTNPLSPSYHSFEDDDVIRRRELAFRAAQRRLQRH